MVAKADELITERRKLLIQLAVVGAGAVLLQGAHHCACSLFTAQDQGLLHSSQSPQSLQAQDNLCCIDTMKLLTSDCENST